MRLSIGDGANDGARGEGDDIAADVEDLRGGSGNDTMIGSAGRNRLFGLSGNDQLIGRGGDDIIVGGAGTDVVDGRDSAAFVDQLRCGAGAGDQALADMGDQVQGGCEIVVQNDPPTAVTLSPATVEENEPVGTLVGTLAATDPDPGDRHTFTLVTGTGAANNASFTISGTQLRTRAVFDFETKDSYTIRVQARDTEGAVFAQPLTITVVDADEPPVAVADTATVAEDDPATTVDVLANDTDVDGGPMVIDSVSQPAHGMVTNGGTDVSYQPDTDFCGADSFTYALNGGSTATVAVTVTCVDDLPVAVDDTATVAEDDPATTVDVLANDADADGDPFTVDTVTQPANGTVVVTNGGDDVTYEPDPDFCGADSFTYSLDPGGSTATVAVTVSCVDDDPVAVDDTATVTEDAAASTVDVLANDTDVDNGPIAITSVTQPVNGTVVITNGGDDVTYQPDADFCGADSFTYTLDPGGSIGTVSVTVTCVDDDPVAVDDTTTVVEDAAATPVDVLANDTDVDDGPIAITSVTQPVNGTVVITNGGDDLTYQPDPNYCNSQPGGTPDTFTYTLDPGGSTATVDVTVTCVAEDPVAVDDTATVAEDDPATTVDVLANDVDADSVGITIDTVTQPANGTVVNGADDVTYQPDADFCGADTFTYTLDPGGSTATVSVTVTCVDDNPVAVDDTATVTEDDPATPVDVLANDTDIDGGPITIDQVTQPTNGTVVVANGGDDLTYQPDANYCNTQTGGSPDTFTYTLTPGGSTATVSVTVTCVNDPVVAVNDTATVVEDAAATAVNVLANDTDVEGDPITITSASEPANGTVVLTGGSPGARTGLTYQPNLNYCNTQPGGTADTFTYTINGGDDATVAITVTCVDDPPVAVNDTATVAEDAAATAIPVLNNDTDVDNGPKAITVITQPTNGTVVTTGGGAGLTYQPNLNYCNSQPGGTPDTFTYTITGGSTATVAVTVTCVDDPPVAVNDTATVLEDAAATAITVLVNDTDIDAGPTTINTVTQPGNGTVAITGGGTGLTYQPAANYCNNPPGTTPDTFTYTLNGGSTATVSMTVTCVNDLPIADDESFTGAIGNTVFVVDDPTDGAPNPTALHNTITGDILAGDTDVDGPGPLVIVAGTFATNDGGSVTIEADGDFVYTPAAGTSCTDTSDSFSYTVTDQNTPIAGTDLGQVTITIANCVWYVSNNAPGNVGTSAAPFDTLAQAETASAAGHTIFVFDGDNTTTGYAAGFTLKASQRLIGEAATLTVGTVTLHTGNPAARPTISDNGADVIELAAGNTVTGVGIDPQGAGGGIAGGTGDAGGTITDVTIIDTSPFGTQPGVELDATTGTFNISGLAVTTNGATGIRLNNAGTVNFASAGTITITTTGGKALDAIGATTSFGTSSVIDDVTVTGSSTGGVNLTATTGNLTLGDGSGTDLALTTTSGTTAALFSTHTGTLGVNPFGTDNVSATGGPAVDITGPGTFDFDDVDSTNSSTDGINLDNFGTGNFTAVSGDIGGATGIAFDLAGGTGIVTYPGNLNNGSGASVEITGRSGGTVTLSGQINDTNDTGGGITLTSNTGGTTNITNATKTLNTTTNPAVTFTTSNGHTLNITGGNLDIDTTTGQGINANDAGTITITGTNNTITSTTGTALNITTTDIGAADATFQSISANGAANGIVLNTTGTSGGLTVSGNGTPSQGGDNSGGTIQSTAGFGISLTNTTNPSFRNMRLLNTGDSGVNGTQVNGLSFVDGMITGAGDASDENSITFDDSLTATPNLTGVVTITNNVINQTEAEGVDIENWAGTISNANISNNALSDTGDVATPGSAITLIGSGTPTSAASITRAAINNNTITDFRAGVGIQVRAGNVNAGGPPGHAGIAGSPTDVIAITGNLMNGGTGGVGNQPDRFFTGGASGIGQGNFNLSNNGTAANRLRNIDCIAIELQADGPVTMTSTVSNNFINPNSAVGCAGIAVGTDDPSNLGAGTHTTLISGNNVMGTDGPGIFPIVRDSGSTMIARVLNNTVAAPIATNAARAGIRVDSGSAEGDTTMCLEISGNTTAGSTNNDTGTTSPGINLRKQGTDPAVNTFGIEGLTPSPTGTPNVENHVNSLNTSTPGTFGVGGTALLSAQTGFTSCVAP